MLAKRGTILVCWHVPATDRYHSSSNREWLVRYLLPENLRYRMASLSSDTVMFIFGVLLSLLAAVEIYSAWRNTQETPDRRS
jgi:hypothetical protein